MSIPRTVSLSDIFAGPVHWEYFLNMKENLRAPYDGDSELTEVEQRITTPADTICGSCLEACSILEREGDLKSQAALVARAKLLGSIPCKGMRKEALYKLPLSKLISFGREIAPLLSDVSDVSQAEQVISRYIDLSMHLRECDRYAGKIKASADHDASRADALDFLHYSCFIDSELPSLIDVMRRFRDDPRRTRHLLH